MCWFDFYQPAVIFATVVSTGVKLFLWYRCSQVSEVPWAACKQRFCHRKIEARGKGSCPNFRATRNYLCLHTDKLALYPQGNTCYAGQTCSYKKVSIFLIDLCLFCQYKDTGCIIFFTSLLQLFHDCKISF